MANLGPRTADCSQLRTNFLAEAYRKDPGPQGAKKLDSRASRSIPTNPGRERGILGKTFARDAEPGCHVY